MQVNLSEVKEFLKVEHYEDDNVLQMMIDGAIDYTETYLNRPILESNMDDTNRWKVPSSIYIAILLLVSTWYENRTNMVIGKVTKDIEYSTHTILSPHRIRSV